MRIICSLFIQIWCLASLAIRNFSLLCNFKFWILSSVYRLLKNNICCLLCNSPSCILLFLLFLTIVQMGIHKLLYRLHFSNSFFFIFLWAFAIHLQFFLKMHAQNEREFPSVDARSSGYYRVIHLLFYKPHYSIIWLNICFSKKIKSSSQFFLKTCYLSTCCPPRIYLLQPCCLMLRLSNVFL